MMVGGTMTIEVTAPVRKLYFRLHGRRWAFRAAGAVWRFADDVDSDYCKLLRLPDNTPDEHIRLGI